MGVKDQAFRKSVSTKADIRNVLEAKGFHCREDRDGVFCQKKVGEDVAGNVWTESVNVEVDAEQTI